MNVKALLKQIPTVAYLYAALGVAAIGAYQGWAHYQREIGRRDVLIAQAERTNATLRHQQDSLAKAYHVDTVRLTRYRLKTDSLTTTVELWKHDTLKVVEYVAKADTAIKACTQALSTCEERVGVAERGWAGARSEIALLKASMPGPGAKVRQTAIGAILGGAVVFALTR